MLDRIRSIRDKTLSPIRQPRRSQSSFRLTSPTQASGDQSISQPIISGIPLDQLGSTTPGELSREAQTSSTVPLISPTSHTASSARFVSLDAQSDTMIPMIQVVDSSQDVHSDADNALPQSADVTPAPPPTWLGEERRRIAYEAFKTTLGTLNEVAGVFPPLKLATAGLPNLITIFEVRGLEFVDVYLRCAQVTMKQCAVQNTDDFNDITELLKAILAIFDRYREDERQSAIENHLQELSESVNASRCWKELNDFLENSRNTRIR